MRIEKWYVDCVTPAGTGMIGYAAQLERGILTLRCAEALAWRGAESPARQRMAFGGALPICGPTELRWGNPALRAGGHWQPIAAGIPPMTLHEDDSGRIEWTCCCPAARAETFVGETRYAGFGYAERLVLTIRPARLPMRELRWGRFIGEDQSCVWIYWRGAVERQWCFHNGQPVEARTPGRQGLAWEGGRLHLEPGATVRDGAVGQTALAGAPWLRWLLPRKLAGVKEAKWCSRGVLTGDDGRACEGWAIHEVAEFP